MPGSFSYPHYRPPSSFLTQLPRSIFLARRKKEGIFVLVFPTFLAQEKTELALFLQGSAAKLAVTHFLGNSNILHLHFFWEIVANPLETGSFSPTKSGHCDLTGLINSPPPPPIRTMQCGCLREKEGREKKRQFRKWEKGGGGTEFAKSLPFPKKFRLGIKVGRSFYRLAVYVQKGEEVSPSE